MTASSTERRCLAIWFPYLSTDRLRRTKTSTFYALPAERPLIVAGKVQNALRIVAADATAHALGLMPGLALADARARVRNIAVAEANPAADMVLLNRVADWCDRYTPFGVLNPPDGLVLDITGCAHLFGGERIILADVTARLASFGFSVRTAIAGTPDAARAVAYFGKDGVIPSGHDAVAVGPLPVAALGIELDMAVALRRAGLKTIADLADCPRAPLAARFGSALIDKLDWTLGRRNAPVSPRRIVPVCRAERGFAEPITRLEDVTAALRVLTSDLARELEARGEGGRRFEASLFRVDGAVRRMGITTARPNREPAVILKLFEKRLDALADPIDAGFGFELIRLAAITTEPLLPAQPPLDGSTIGEEAIASLIDRLSARFGPECVLRYAPRDTHIPERTGRLMLAVTMSKAVTTWPSPSLLPRPLSLFDPPQPIDAIAEVPDGPPLRFRWRRVMHHVIRAEGPERIAPEWWRAKGASLTRDYYRIEDRQGRRYWLFREGLYSRETATSRWFLHGLFP